MILTYKRVASRSNIQRTCSIIFRTIIFTFIWVTFEQKIDNTMIFFISMRVRFHIGVYGRVARAVNVVYVGALIMAKSLIIVIDRYTIIFGAMLLFVTLFFYTNDRPLEISSGKYPYCGFLHHRNNKKNFVCQKRAVVCVESHSFQIYAVDFAGIVHFPSSFLVPARASVVDFGHLHGSSRWWEQADWCPQLPQLWVHCSGGAVVAASSR